MPSLSGRLGRLARSPKGRKLVDRAQKYANSPEGRRKIQDARSKLAKRR